ncbi:MAG: helix-turn-helix domain-containing protein [Rudanella sp.]|nr:helix-turn-helix domain-containing protein [Rudanella sp.]
MRVDDADLLTEVLTETPTYSTDLKALVLPMVDQQEGTIETVSAQTGLPKSTLYYWLAGWNQAQRTTKRKR